MIGSEILELELKARAARGEAERTGSATDFERAVALSRRALEHAPAGHAARAGLLNTLCGTLRAQYLATGDTDALRTAIAVGREAVAVPLDDPYRGTYLISLAVVLRLESERTWEPDLLAEAEATAREAVAVTGGGHPHQGAAQTVLVNALVLRHQVTGDVAAVREAALRAEPATRSASPGSDGGSAFNTLANARLLLHRATSDDDALLGAIDAAERALKAAPPGHPKRALHANTLASALLTRYGRTGRTADLKEAVRFSRVSAEAIPPGHALRSAVLHTLVSTLLELYGRSGEEKDLDEAIGKAGEALALESGALAPPALHNALSMAMMLRYLGGGGQKALAGARAEAARACEAAGDDHPQRFVYLSNLAKALRAEYEIEPSADLLRELVEAGRHLVAQTTETSLHRTDHLVELALALLHEHRHSGDPGVLGEARRHASEAASMPSALPWQRVTALRLLGRVGMALGDPGAALDSYRAAVESLPQVAPRRLERMDRESGLGRIAGLGPEAAGAALAAGAPETAVELLEQARGVLIEERLGARSQTARLAAVDPGLAAEFERLRVLLDLADEGLRLPGLADAVGDRSGRTPPVPPGTRPAEQGRARLEERWHGVLGRVRGIEGFGDFLGRPAVAGLRREAAAGPVVLLNSGVHGCTALILADDPDRPVRCVPLAGVTEQSVAEQVVRLRDAQEAGQDIAEVLRWVWDRVTEPVLSALGHTGPMPLEQRPRLWWCATGSFTFLPLHAAGHHDRGDAERRYGRTVMDRVVSSYTPTVRALGHARRAASGARHEGRRVSPPQERGSLLVVAMPETPGESSLLGVDKEVAEITAAVADAEVLRGRHATREAVLGALYRHPVAHFACHGVSEPGDPSTSRLLLDDHLIAPLDVATIVRQDLAQARLAYLSACSTTETAARYGDEAVHVTAAFLLAGFAGVVGTLWPVKDSAARAVSVAFHRRMFAEGTGNAPVADADTGGALADGSVAGAAYALQHAVDRLRMRRPGLPGLWSAHVHVGA
ncbi:CHAT domain-containing protein [Streptomyces albipurpureus]|uniref:CHAT domain-containing protein n=1 Tax=Streptomyces albipurpureus TaxID=2897419 RepID=A0ABT0UGV8_9ACTN|nr:CHAT domain-containing protein [Streptomyces sp. CWNU-1]MCM2387675.1 CHAT domain-containing protein [Streptomyces sp. CWNU-1]